MSILISTIVHNVPALPKWSKSKKILDIGCGSGDTLLLLKNLGWDAYGLEIDKKAVAVARKNRLNNVTFGGYQDLDRYPDNYFDVIRMYHVIEHLDDSLRCLKLIYKKIKINGEIIVGTPNSGSIAAKLCKSYWYNLDSPRHLYLFNPTVLQKLISQSGFKYQSTKYCSAGGIIGSIQYYVNEKLDLKLNLIHRPLLVILFYPIEWLFDKLTLGDVFVLRATKSKKAVE